MIYLYCLNRFVIHALKFAGPCLYQSGLVPDRLTYLDDVRCPSDYQIGLTNMVERTTRGSADLSR